MSLQRLAEQAKEKKKESELVKEISDKILKHKIEKGASRQLYKEMFQPVTTELEKQSESLSALPAITQQLTDLGQEITDMHALEGIPQLFEEPKAIAAPKPPKTIDVNLDKEIDPDVLLDHDLPKLTELISNDDIHEMRIYQRNVADTLKRLGGKKGGKKRSGKNVEQIDYKIDNLRNYNETLKDMIKHRSKFTKGTGIGMCNPQELINDLELICGSLDSGNNSQRLKNMGIDIIDELLKLGTLSNDNHEQLYKKYFT
mgnify:CR=1 FL=1